MTDITILTQDACASCDRAKQILAGITREYPVRVHEISLASDEGRALATRHGIAFAPGILIDGETFGYGRLSERKLRKHLAVQASTADRAEG